MKHNIARLTALLIILSAALSTSYAKRLLLPPPDGYKGVEINGVKYVVGQVYVQHYTDTTELKQFGFRGFEVIGSTHTYKKVKAIWPLDTDLNTLPGLVIGLTYEKAQSVEEMQRAYKNSDPELQTRGYSIFENHGVYYGGPVSSSSFYGNGRYYNSRSYNNTGAPYCSWENDYNPDAYRYRTTTRSKLKPTNLGSYPDNKFLKRKCDCRGACIHRGRSLR